MCAVYAQCASVHPIRLFYLTKWEAPYKGNLPSAAWEVILNVERDGRSWTKRSRLEGRSVPEFDGGAVRQADDEPVRSCRLPCSARRWVGRGCLLPATRRQLEELKFRPQHPAAWLPRRQGEVLAANATNTVRIAPLQIVFVQRGRDLSHRASHPCELVAFLHSDPFAKLPFTLMLQNWSGLPAEPFQNGKLGA